MFSSNEMMVFFFDARVFSQVVIVHEHRGEPDGMVVCHLPFGPTAYFGSHLRCWQNEVVAETREYLIISDTIR